MDEWLEEILADLPGFLSRCTPIERLEFQSELDRLADEGHAMIIHTTKPQMGKSSYKQWIIDRWPAKEGGADGESTNTTI